MADDPTKLVFTADTSDAQSKVKTLRGVIDEFTASLGLSGDQAKRVGDAYETVYTKLNVDAPTAEKALAAVRAEHEKSGPAVQKHDFNIKSLAQSFLGVVSVAAIVRANLADIRAELAPLVKELQDYAVENGASTTAVDLFSNSIEMMLDPMTIAKNLISNFKIAWGEFEKGVGLSTDATGKLSDELERVNALLAKHQADVQADTQSLKERTDAIASAVFIEERHGGVTAKSREEVEALVREYEKTGEIPPKLDRIRRSLGIMTEAEKEAAAEAKRRGEEQAAASEKAAEAVEREMERRREAVRAETEAIEGSAAALAERAATFLAAVAAAEEDGTVTVAAQERIQAKLRELLEDFRRFGVEPPEEIQAVIDKYGQLETAGAAVADQQREIEEAAKAAAEALQAQVDAARAAQGDAEKSVAETQARIAELERKGQEGALTLAEDQELFDLRAKLFEQQQDLNQATEEAEVVSLELEQAQAALGDRAAKNEQIFADLEMGLISQADAIRLLTAEEEKRTESLQDLYDAAVEAGAGAEQAQSDFDAAFEGAADSAEEAADAVARAGEEGASGVREMGDAASEAGAAVEELGTKGERAAEKVNFAKAREDVAWLEEHVPTLIELVGQLAAAAAAVELGGPADESEPDAPEAN